MNKKKNIVIAILLIIVICLLGFLAFVIGNKIGDKSNDNSVAITKNRTVKSSKDVANHFTSSDKLKNKLDDNDYYVLATIKEINTNSPHFRLDLKTLNQDAQHWTLKGDCFRLGRQNDGKMGIIPNGNGAGDEFISIDKNNVTVAHMGGGKDNASDYWMNQTFRKKDLVNEFIKSDDDVTLLKQTVVSLRKNNQTFNDSVSQESKESVDTKNLTESQFKKWVEKAYNGTDYLMEFDDQNQYPEIHVYHDNGVGNAVIDVTYRVNGDGNLQKVIGFNAQPDNNNDWQDVNVPYPGN